MIVGKRMVPHNPIKQKYGGNQGKDAWRFPPNRKYDPA